MATKLAVLKAMKSLAAGYAGTIDEDSIAFWCAVLSPLSDEQVLEATAIVARTWVNPFLPPPAVIFQAAAPAKVAVDAEAIARRISKLGHHHPNAGWIYPSVETVREQLGEAIGYAYAAAGGRRLFADNETTRDIAVRDFQTALVEAEKRPHAQLPVLGAGNGNGSPLPASLRDTIKRIGSGPSRDDQPVTLD